MNLCTRQLSSRNLPEYALFLTQFKIEHWKLDDTPKPLYGVYQSTKFDSEIPRLNFSNVSLTQPKRLQSGPYDSVLKGVLYLFNTKETYEAADLADIYGNNL